MIDRTQFKEALKNAIANLNGVEALKIIESYCDTKNTCYPKFQNILSNEISRHINTYQSYLRCPPIYRNYNVDVRNAKEASVALLCLTCLSALGDPTYILPAIIGALSLIEFLRARSLTTQNADYQVNTVKEAPGELADSLLNFCDEYVSQNYTVINNTLTFGHFYSSRFDPEKMIRKPLQLTDDMFPQEPKSELSLQNSR